MLKSLLGSHIHKPPAKEWHGQILELANTSKDKTGDFERMRRRTAGFVAVGSIEP